MRRVFAVFVLAGCTQLFGVKHIDTPSDAGAADVAPDTAIDALVSHPCFQDTFDDNMINSTLFHVTQPVGGSTRATGGAVVITWPAMKSAANYGDVETNSVFDMRGGEVSVDVDSFMGDMAEGELEVRLDATHIYSISIDPSTIKFFVNDGGTQSTPLAATATTLRPATLKIAHDLASDMIRYSFTNANGTVPLSIATAFSPQGVTFDFNAGSYGSAVAAGQAVFDNFAMSGPYCH